MAKAVSQYKLNQQIEDFIREKDAKNVAYSQDEVLFIQQYEGSGGQGSKGASGEGVLYEFYTPEYVVELMWDMAYNYGFDKTGTVLEPSIATGRLIEPAPDKSLVTGFEINPISARICEIIYPEAHINRGYFETAFLEPPRFTTKIKDEKLTWLKGYPFSLVIGNPPYGKHKNKYSSYFTKPKMQQIEMFFMYYSLKLLKPGGLLVYLTSSNFLRNGISYNNEKDNIGKLADLVDAYRLPHIFRFSDVSTDIIVFKRK